MEHWDLPYDLGATDAQRTRLLEIPSALPVIFGGLRVGVTLAVIGAVVAEISNPSGGLGAVIVQSGMSFDTPLAFAAIVLLALLSTTMFYLVVALERLLVPWARSITG